MNSFKNQTPLLMSIIYVFIEFLGKTLQELEDLAKKNVNKHFKRFVRLLGKLSEHLQQEQSVNWETLQKFSYEFIPNKAYYGQLVKTPLCIETRQVLTVLAQDCKDLHLTLMKDMSYAEAHIIDFIKKSAESVLAGNFCKDQESLLKELTTKQVSSPA